MRGVDYPESPDLASCLLLPADTPRRAATSLDPAAAWSAWCAGSPVLLVRSVAHAHRLLLAATEIGAGDLVALPATATSGLVEAVKEAGAARVFLPLGEDLSPETTWVAVAGARLIIDQPLPGAAEGRGTTTTRVTELVDAIPRPDQRSSAAAMIVPLRLDADERRSGAAIVFGATAAGAALEVDARALARADDVPDPAGVIAQLSRWRTLAARQAAGLQAMSEGLVRAGGLPVASGAKATLAGAVALRVPDEVDPGTFFAYAAREQTPVGWLPVVRPLHHAAVATVGAATAARTGRWLLVPVGPAHREEEIVHGVLGVVKAAEYLGVRWRTDPARARWYARLLDGWYGPDHDAYRPIFPTPLAEEP